MSGLDISNFGKSKIIDLHDFSKDLFPQRSKVAMCHGTFDLVHPGHLRQFIFAKSLGDILVVSLTCDKHISKANFRPHVPEDLRALALAAIELVDYIIIDKNPTPIEIIKAIKPDFFVKGYEYKEAKLGSKTDEERESVEKYGGKMIFSPGDIVFSSSKWIENSPPDIRLERLQNHFKKFDMEPTRVNKLLDRFKDCSVLIVGDLIIDTLVKGSVIGGMTKTPTISVRHEKSTDYIGGAGIVAMHLAAAGANVKLVTVVGEDSKGVEACNRIRDAGIELVALEDETRPTINKNAIIASDYRLLKLDYVDNRPVDDWILSEISSVIRSFDGDMVIFSDFRHGIFNPGSIDALIEAIPDDVFKVADTQVASRWGNILDFKNFDLITPNEREARFALGDQETIIRALGEDLMRESLASNVILKCGSNGILGFSLSEEEEIDFFYLDSVAREVIDPVGAGDGLLAYSSLALFAGGSLPTAGLLGSIAAALVCETDGNVPVEQSEVKARLADLFVYYPALEL